MSNLLSAPINLGPSGGFQGIGPLGLEGKSASEAPLIFSNVISTTIGIITLIAIIWFIVQLLTGAVGIIGSGGDKNKIEQARTKITSGLVGLIVVIAGVFIVDLIGSLLGINILNFAGNFTSIVPK